MNSNEAVRIDITDGDNINWALKKFKRQCDTLGILKEYRKRKAHRKPSVAKKEKIEAAEKRRNKEARKRRTYTRM
jgi:small subunit ribosomal protein S21